MTANSTKHHPTLRSPDETCSPVPPIPSILDPSLIGAPPPEPTLLDPSLTGAPFPDATPTPQPSAPPFSPDASQTPALTPSKTLRVLPLGLSLTLSTAIALVSLSVGIGSYLALQTRIQQQQTQHHQRVLDQARMYHQMDNFRACLGEVAPLEANSPGSPDVQQLQRSCYQGLIAQAMEQAQSLADQGQYKQAIASLSPLVVEYDDAQIKGLVKQLSQRMREMAWEYYNSPVDSFQQAVVVLQAIPQTSSLYADAQADLQQMQTERLSHQNHLQQAAAALEDRDLITARRALDQMIPHPFWQLEAQPLRQYLETLEQGQRYAEILQQAEAALSQQEPRNAIAIVQQLPDASPWLERKDKIIARAEADLRQQGWCQTLFSWVVDCYQ